MAICLHNQSTVNHRLGTGFCAAKSSRDLGNRRIWSVWSGGPCVRHDPPSRCWKCQEL